jgi:molybdopterin/thiamine biosynthesis adenylyltransferase
MISPRFERNLGFMLEEEQASLHDATVAVAGAGGDGGMLSVQLARLGVENFRLADPDPFEIENINRQAVCTDRTIGRNKAEAVAEYITDINPKAKIELFTDGVSYENASEFVAGSDLVIDETEFTLHALGISLARESRRQGIPQMTALNIGFGAIVTTYKSDGRTYERQLGFGDDQDIESIAAAEVKLDRWLPYLPSYGDLSVLEKVASGEKSAPSIAPGVAMAASIGSTQALLNLLKGRNKRPDPVYAPKAIVIDAMSLRADVISYNRVSHYRHLAHAVVRNALKLNPKASY